MIQWVYERTKRSQLVDRVLVATDDDRIMRAVAAFGGEAVMTSTDHPTGTDRIAEVARGLDCGIVVNVQGDEPLIEPAMIDEAIAPLAERSRHPHGHGLQENRAAATRPSIPTWSRWFSTNRGFALYVLPRAHPLGPRRLGGQSGLCDELPLTTALYKHIGLYVYRREFLLRYAGPAPDAARSG